MEVESHVVRPSASSIGGIAIFFLLICVPFMRADEIREINLLANDLIYDPLRELIYASVSANAPSNGNSIAVIEPRSATIQQWITVGVEPTKLALSDNGEFLYVGLASTSTVQRVNLNTGMVDLEFALGAGVLGPSYTSDIAVLPGSPEVVAVAQRYGDIASWAGLGVGIYDAGLLRTQTTFDVAGCPSIESSTNAMRLYGWDTHNHPGSFFRFDVDASGIHVIDSIYDLLDSRGSFRDMKFDRGDGRIYTTDGEVLDPEASLILGRFAGVEFDSPVQPDSVVGRTFFLHLDGTPSELLGYDQHTFEFLGRLPVQGLFCGYGYCSSLIRWGIDGLALRNTQVGKIYLVRSCLVRCADLSVTMTAEPDPPVFGSNVTYIVTVTNHGPDDAPNVELTDSLPSGLDFFSASIDCQHTNGLVICQLGTLGDGASTSVTFIATAIAPAILPNQVDVTADLSDSNPTNNSAASLELRQPEIEIHGAYRFTRIADSTDDGLSGFYPWLSINESGSVAFVCSSGIFAGTGTSLKKLTDASPSSPISFNDAGVVAFLGSAGGTNGVFVARGGTNLTVAFVGDVFHSFGVPTLNNAGTVAFRGDFNTGGYGICVGDGGPITTLYLGANPSLIVDTAPHGLNDEGTVAFWAGRAGSDWFTEILTGNGGSPKKVATGKFPYGALSINETGMVAYVADIGNEAAGVYVTSARSSPRAIVKKGGQFGGTGAFGLASLNNHGEVAFWFPLTAGGVGIFTGPNAVGDKVIATGDPLFNSTVNRIDNFSGEGLNDAGQVAFVAGLADGRQVVVRADPIAVHDLAITMMRVPKRVILSPTSLQRSALVQVQIQNRSRQDEVISDLAALTNLVTLTVESLGACPSPVPVLVNPPRLPFTLAPKRKLSLKFSVTFNCANDATLSTAADPGHEDYRFTATVNHAALDGIADIHPADDVCPRTVASSCDIDPFPDGTIRDCGCGAKRPDGTFGGDLLTDIIVR